MSANSNNTGRAFEYAFLTTLERAIGKSRKVALVRDTCFDATFRAWEKVSKETQDSLVKSAEAVVPLLFEMEPLVLEEDGTETDVLTICSAPDSKGEEGDVRDVLLSRKSIVWEIGFSLKHNHAAVKHCRLARTLDFGDKWFGVPCSQEYWNEVESVFNALEREKAKQTRWNALSSKEDDVYVPILNAFIAEVKRCCAKDPTVPRKMVEYLMGKHDFYKAISYEQDRMTRVSPHNFQGTLNRSGKRSKPTFIVPKTALPTRLVCLEFKPGSKTTAEAYFDYGWQFNFRLHNASTVVEPSLKFDVQLVGKPASILTIDCVWK